MTADNAVQSVFVAELWRPYMAHQLVWRAISRIQNQQINGSPPPAYGKRSKEYIAPTRSWCSVKYAIIESQQARSVDVFFARIINVKINPVEEFDPEDTPGGLKYCCAPGSYLNLECSIVNQIAWKDNKLVLFLSTVFSDADVDRVWRERRPKLSQYAAFLVRKLSKM